MRRVVMFLVGILASVAMATPAVLPASTISEKTLGGTVLLIDMKYNLVIQAKEQKHLTREMGDEKRENFYRDIIMKKDVIYLLQTYGVAEAETLKLKAHHPKMVLEIIRRYSQLLDEQSPEKT
jgi:hypothetical protein